MKKNETYAHWFVCENILAHDGQLGILHMDEPEVFILIRNYGDSLFASFEEFCDGVAEVNFFHAGDREATDLTDLNRRVEFPRHARKRGRKYIL